MSKSTKSEESTREIAAEYGDRAQESFNAAMQLIAKVSRIRSMITDGEELAAIEKIDALTKDILRHGNTHLALATELRNDERFDDEDHPANNDRPSILPTPLSRERSA